MEYFLGSIITLALIVIVNRLASRSVSKNTPIPVIANQSRTFEFIKKFMEIPDPFMLTNKTQAVKHYNHVNLRVLFLDDQAFWIKENTLFVADVVDGVVDNDTTKQVDTMGMDSVQLEKTIFIVEKLREGIENDSGDSRKS